MDKNREQYSLASEVVDLNPETITPADIYSLVDLTGEQAQKLVTRLQRNLTDKGVKESVKSAKTKI